MILCFRNLVFSLTSSIIFFSISQAQGSSSCIYTEHTAANATGFVEVAGLQPFIYTPPVQNSTWTISTAINEVQDFESNSYVIEQSFWLDTNPLISTSPADLPYMGCAILLTGFSSPQISTGTTPATNGSDSCNGVFDTSCYYAIIETIDEFILDNTAPNIPDVCQTIISKPPPECKDYAWTALSATQPFGNPSFSESVNSSCPASIFNGTMDIITQSSDRTSPLSNYTTYDTWVKQATPLVLTGFTKNISDQTPRWGQTTLACLTPDHVISGSRIPPTSGAQRSVRFESLKLGGLLVMFAIGVGFLC